MFKPGDRVSFIDKYGKQQVGIFKGLEDVPCLGGTEIRAIVVAKAFADIGYDTDVNCMVPPDCLTHF